MSWIKSRMVLETWPWVVETVRGLRKRWTSYPPYDVAALHPVPRHPLQLRVLKIIAD